VNVEIWSDIACPWCAVGKRRFERALADFEHRDEVTVIFRSFELDPGAPAAREGSTAENLAKKYGTSLEQAKAMNERMTETAAQDGLEFRFDLARGGNTFDAHRLLHLAHAKGVQDAVLERLYRAHFTEQQSVFDTDALVKLAAEAGLDADEARAVLESNRYADRVEADVAEAQQLGARGVPFFVIDGKFGVSGAQAPELFAQALARAWEQRAPVQLAAAGGEVCGDDGCVVPSAKS